MPAGNAAAVVAASRNRAREKQSGGPRPAVHSTAVGWDDSAGPQEGEAAEQQPEQQPEQPEATGRWKRVKRKVERDKIHHSATWAIETVRHRVHHRLCLRVWIYIPFWILMLIFIFDHFTVWGRGYAAQETLKVAVNIDNLDVNKLDGIKTWLDAIVEEVWDDQRWFDGNLTPPADGNWAAKTDFSKRPYHGYISRHYKVMGSLQLWTMRVQSEPCQQFPETYKTCHKRGVFTFSTDDDGSLDTNPFGPPEDKQRYKPHAVHNAYFMEPLDINLPKAAAVAKLAQLEADGFFDYNLFVFEVGYPIYSPDMSMGAQSWNGVSFYGEMPNTQTRLFGHGYDPNGRSSTSNEVTKYSYMWTGRPNPYPSGFFNWSWMCFVECCLVAMIAVFAVWEANEAYYLSHRRLFGYFTSAWNWMELLCLTLFCVTFFDWVALWFSPNPAIQTIRDALAGNEQLSFWFLYSSFYRMRIYMALNAFLFTIRIIKYMSTQRKLRQFFSMFTESLDDILSLLTVSLVWLFGFAIFFMTMVGHQSPYFQHSSTALLGLGETFFGTDGGLSLKSVTGSVTAYEPNVQLIMTLMYFILVMVMTMVLANVAITIMMNAYDKTREGYEDAISPFESAGIYLKKCGKELEHGVIRCFGCKEKAVARRQAKHRAIAKQAHALHTATGDDEVEEGQEEGDLTVTVGKLRQMLHDRDEQMLSRIAAVMAAGRVDEPPRRHSMAGSMDSHSSDDMSDQDDQGAAPHIDELGFECDIHI